MRALTRWWLLLLALACPATAAPLDDPVRLDGRLALAAEEEHEGWVCGVVGLAHELRLGAGPRDQVPGGSP